ncbi:MAG TPA: DNA-3-methyladenine glycosylase [Fimbriimonadales bacterium]|jgi:DNA-3-methyladenine glycosylase|nr:DNA-3-methyladenine glycosylase [Fimbriimonadales bacterium]
MNAETKQILGLPAAEAAPLVLGMFLFVEGVGGRIVEVEAYSEDDPASHSHGGPKGRNLPMFLAGGHIYVYRSYGVHWCMNLVTGPNGRGEAVLLRALEPTSGLDQMRKRRPGIRDERLCAGPGNLTLALGVDGSMTGLPLGGQIKLEPGARADGVWVGPRIGISVSVDAPLRFCLGESRSLSRKHLKSARPM